MLRLIETWGSPTMITGPMQDDFFQAATDQQLGREEGGGGGVVQGMYKKQSKTCHMCPSISDFSCKMVLFSCSSGLQDAQDADSRR